MENLNEKLKNIKKLKEEWLEYCKKQDAAWGDVEKKLDSNPQDTNEINKAFEKYKENCVGTKESLDKYQKACDELIAEDLDTTDETMSEIIVSCLKQEQLTPRNTNDWGKIIDWLLKNKYLD